ncbi:MAG: hypothetical protein LIV24_02790 [Eubacterium sp.]|nr:hypothetical protein [Eubacterium sp.]
MDISSAVYIFLEDKKKIDKYGPQDGHPAIAGLNILHFLQERLQKQEMDQFTEIVRGCQFIPYDETQTDARTDKASDILGLLWRKGAMKLYNSEDYADVVDYVYIIDLDQKYLRIISNYEYTIPFTELAGLSDEDYMEKIQAFEGDAEEAES